MANKDFCRPLYEVITNHLPEILAKKNTGHLKSDGTFVSEGDILCQNLVIQYFKDNHGDSLLISEELPLPEKGLEDSRFIIVVDPIDGTENFVSGLKEWGISVSVYKDGVHYQSMIALPEMGICLCTGDVIPETYRSRICGLSSYLKARSFQSLPDGYEFRIMGCCVYNIYNVIKGSYSRFIHLSGAFSWDVLAGFNLAIEHGVRVYIDELGEYTGQMLEHGRRYHFILSKD